MATVPTTRPDDPTADPTAALRAFLDASPSPWHAGALGGGTARGGRLRRGRRDGDVGDVPGGRLRRAGGALVAWRRPPGAATCRCASSAPTPTRPACASSRIPTPPASGGASSAVEVYGGVLLNSWLDRDLGVAGRLVARDGSATLVAVARARRTRAAAGDPPRPRGQRAGRRARPAAAPHPGVGDRAAPHRSPSGSPSAPAVGPGRVGAVPVRRAAGRGARRRPVAARQRAARQPGVVLGRHGRHRRRAAGRATSR